MDSSSFDRLTRHVAAGLTRRRALTQAIAGLGAAVTGIGIADLADAAKKKNKGKKGCKKNQTKCNGKCIGKNLCCNDRSCTGAKTGSCVRKKCRPSFTTCTTENATVSFVEKAPAGAPVSAGAVKFVVGLDPDLETWAHLRNGDFEGELIANIEKLTYSVYLEPFEDGSCPGASRTRIPYMAIYARVGDQPHVLVGGPGENPTECETWVDIEGAEGLWWMPTAPSVAPWGDPKTLAEIADALPGIAIQNRVSDDDPCQSQTGGLRLEAGEWSGDGEVEMYVSHLQVEIGDKKATYRF